MKRTTEELLIKLGIMPNLKGFERLCRAIEIINNSDKTLEMVEIYERVSDIYGEPPRTTERVIKWAIGKIDLNFWRKYCDKVPKTAEALHLLAWLAKEKK